VLLTLARSFYGKENPRLTAELLSEASGIFNWALKSLDRLRERGHFIQPESAREALRHLEELSSPVGAFVRDACTVGPEFEVEKDVLYAAWKDWCAVEGRDRAGTKSTFVRDLRAAVPGVMPAKPRDPDDPDRRRRILTGIALGKHSSRPRTTPAQDPSEEFGPGWSGVDSTEVSTSQSSANGCGHPRLWRARDGVWRCQTCDPPALPSEVVDRRAAT
jgi:putative DNA primase/helicase